MKRIYQIWNCFRAWRLNRWADSLRREADYHRRQAKEHSAYASVFWLRSNDVRALARRIEAAGMQS